jgi:hypothetical protein
MFHLCSQRQLIAGQPAPLPMGKLAPRPSYSPCTLNTNSVTKCSYNLGPGMGTSAYHSERLAIGWLTEPWHHGKLLDLYSWGILDSGQFRARSQRSFFFPWETDERLFPGTFESVLAQLLKGNLKQFLFLYVWGRHTFICLKLLLITCSHWVSICLAQIWKRVW